MEHDLFAFSGKNLFSALLALVPGVINTAIFIYAFFSLPRHRLTTIFNLFLLALFCWQLTDAAYRLSATEQAAATWDRIFCIGYLAAGPLALHFALSVAAPQKVTGSRLVLSLLYVPYAFFTIAYLASPVPLVFHPEEFWGFVNVPRAGTVDEVQRYWTSVLVLVALVFLVVKAIRSRANRAKHVQLLVIAAGLGIPTIQGVLTELIFPSFLSLPEIPLTSLSMTTFSVAAIFVLSRYDLFSISESVPVETVLENLTSFLFVISPERKVIYANEHASAGFGIDSSTLPYFTFDRLFVYDSPDYRRFHREVIDGSLAGYCVKNFAVDMITGPGKVMNLLISTRQIVNNGVLQGILIVARDNTEQRQAELELERSVSLLEATLESITEGILVTDRDGRIVRYNNKFADLWRIPDKELTGWDDSKAVDFVLDQLVDPGQFVTKIRELYENHNRNSFDILELKDGRIYERYSQPQRIHGEGIGRVWSFRDVTERRKAEQTLIQSEKKYKNLFENNPQPMWVFDMCTLAFLDVNPAAVAHYGYSKEEFLSMTLKDIRPEEDIPILEDAIRQPLVGTNRLNMARHRKKKGELIFVEVISHDIDYDHIRTRLVLINDITERRLAEEKILASEHLLSKTQQITHTGSWEWNVTKAKLYWSDELYRIYGLQPQEGITYEKFLQLTHPEDAAMVQEVVSGALEDHRPYNFHYRIMRKDGEVRIIHGQGEVSTDKDTGELKLRGVANDVTERKQSEAKLELQNQELLKTNAELDRFVYSASHELRAPLASILGLINILKPSENDPDRQKIIGMMHSSVERLDTLIRNIADYSRNSRLELQQEKIDFEKLIGDSVRLLYFMNETQKIRMEIEVKGESEFYSDRNRLEVVLNNFISNAIKYHNLNQDDPFIRVRVSYDQKTAQLEITDNGIGIPSRSLDKIFNIFYRATTARSGSGLGLYIVKEIINGLSGSIRVESKEGAGASFFITLPNLQSRRVQFPVPEPVSRN